MRRDRITNTSNSQFVNEITAVCSKCGAELQVLRTGAFVLNVTPCACLGAEVDGYSQWMHASRTLERCWRKHHAGDDSIGLEELTDELCETLLEIVGEARYKELQQKYIAVDDGDVCDDPDEECDL
jgi:hypothetical protein